MCISGIFHGMPTHEYFKKYMRVAKDASGLRVWCAVYSCSFNVPGMKHSWTGDTTATKEPIHPFRQEACSIVGVLADEVPCLLSSSLIILTRVGTDKKR